MKSTLKAKALNEQELDMVSGGGSKYYNDNIPQFGEIKRRLLEKGPNAAFILAIYYFPTPAMHEVVNLMHREVKEGYLGYKYNGKYYDSPVDDPDFPENEKKTYMR